MTDPPPPAGKDHWDKLAILLHPVGGLLTAVAVASLGLIGSRALDRQQNTEARLRLYSELMSRREESESNLRKEMFQSIIGSFFDPGASSMEAKLLKMELLAQNFNEALDLTPLFLHLHREIADLHDPPAVRRAYETRLSGLAQEVIRKQMIVLEAGGGTTGRCCSPTACSMGAARSSWTTSRSRSTGSNAGSA